MSQYHDNSDDSFEEFLEWRKWKKDRNQNGSATHSHGGGAPHSHAGGAAPHTHTASTSAVAAPRRFALF